MKSKVIITMAFIAGLILSSTVLAQDSKTPKKDAPAKEKKVDLSTPQKALEALVESYKTGDMELFKKSNKMTEVGYESYRLNILMLSASYQFAKKMTEKFGKDFSKDSMYEGQYEKTLNQLDGFDSSKSEVKIDGDKATATNPMNPKKTLNLIKTKSGWVIDRTKQRIIPAQGLIYLASMSNSSALRDATKAADEGKTLQEVFDLLGRRMQYYMTYYMRKLQEKRNKENGVQEGD